MFLVHKGFVELTTWDRKVQIPVTVLRPKDYLFEENLMVKVSSKTIAFIVKVIKTEFNLTNILEGVDFHNC